jgi:hypothetical protein
MRNRNVTHYAEPFGYIFAGSHFQRPGRSNPPGRARPVAQGPPARRTNRTGLPGITAGHLQAPPLAAAGSPGRGEQGGPASLLSPESAPAHGGGFLAGAIPSLLEPQSGQSEGLCRSGICEGICHRDGRDGRAEKRAGKPEIEGKP